MIPSVNYDLLEKIRLTNQWIGSAARVWGASELMGGSQTPSARWLQAWGALTEHSFQRMAEKPQWQLAPLKDEDGEQHNVQIRTVLQKDFGNLLHFEQPTGKTTKPRVLLIAPLSGHYATLLRATVSSLLSDCDVFITDWHNARQIPVSAGKFNIEHYTQYLIEFFRHLGPDTHVIAVCQPAPLALAATAYLAQNEPEAQPRSLTMMGGPIDPAVNPTKVSQFSQTVSCSQLQNMSIQKVAPPHKGAGREVYPGMLQLASFMSMNSATHMKSFTDQVQTLANGPKDEQSKHNRFYDEYLCVMDICAEFYLSTIKRIFQNREIAQNIFTLGGKPIDITAISQVPILTIEGACDDIAAPGQCQAALALCSGLLADMKHSHVEPKVGHYGIFSGSAWQNNIRPKALDFIKKYDRTSA